MAKYEQGRAKMMAATAQRRLHFKLYKAGGQWVIAGIAAVTLGLAVGGRPVQAAATTDTTGTVVATAGEDGSGAASRTASAEGSAAAAPTATTVTGTGIETETTTKATGTPSKTLRATASVSGTATAAATAAAGTTPAGTATVATTPAGDAAVAATTTVAASTADVTATAEPSDPPADSAQSYRVEYVNVTKDTGNNQVLATVEGNAAEGPYQVDLKAAGLDPQKYELADAQPTSLPVAAAGTYQVQVQDKTVVLEEPLVVTTTIHYVAAEAGDNFSDYDFVAAGGFSKLADHPVVAESAVVTQSFTVTWDLARDEGVWYEPEALFPAVTSPTVEGMVPAVATYPTGDLRMGGHNYATGDMDIYVPYHRVGEKEALTYAAPTIDPEDAAAGIVKYHFVDLDNGGDEVATYSGHATGFSSRPDMLTSGSDGVSMGGVIAELAALYDYDPAGFAAEGGKANGLNEDGTAAQGEVIDSAVAAGSQITIELRHRHETGSVLFTQVVHFKDADGNTVADDQKWNLGWDTDTDLVREFGAKRHNRPYAPTYTPMGETGQGVRPIQQIAGMISTIDGVATTELAAVSYLDENGVPHDAPEVTVVYDNHPYTIEFVTTNDRGHQVVEGKPYLGQAKDGTYQIDLADAGLDPAKYELSDPTTTSIAVAADQTYQIEVKHRTQILTDEPLVTHRPVRYVRADDENVEVAPGFVIDQTYFKEIDLVTGNVVMYHVQNHFLDRPNPQIAGMVAERPNLSEIDVQDADTSWAPSENQPPIVVRYDAQPYTIEFVFDNGAGVTAPVGTAHLGSAIFDEGTYKIDLADGGLDTSVYQLVDPDTTSIDVAAGQTYQVMVQHPTALQPDKAITTHRIIHYQRADTHEKLLDDREITFTYIPEVDLIGGWILKWHRQADLPDVTSPVIAGYTADVPALNLMELNSETISMQPILIQPEVTVTYTPDVQKASVYFVGVGGRPLVPAMQIEGTSGSAITHTQFVATIQKLISDGYNLVADGTVGATFDKDAATDQYFVVKFEAVAPIAGMPGGGVHAYQKIQVPDVAPSVTEDGYYNNLTPGEPAGGIHVYQKTQVPDVAPSVTEDGYYNNLTPGEPADGIHVYQKTQVPDVAPSVTEDGYYNNLTPGEPAGGIRVYQKTQVPDVAPSVTEADYYNNLTPGKLAGGIHVYQKTQVPDLAPTVTAEDYYNNLTPGELDAGVRVRNQVPDVAPSVTEDGYYNNLTPGEPADGIHVYRKTQVPDVAPSVTEDGYYNNLTPGEPAGGIHVYRKTQVPDVAPSVTEEGYYNNLTPGELDEGVRVRNQVPDVAPSVTAEDYYDNLTPGELDAGVRVRNQVPDVAPSVTEADYYNNLTLGELDEGIRVRNQVPDVAPSVTEADYYNNLTPGELDEGVRVRNQVPDVAPSVTKAAYYDHRTTTPAVTALTPGKQPTTGAGTATSTTPTSLPVTGPRHGATTAAALAPTAAAAAQTTGQLPQTGETTRGALALAGVGLLSLLGLATLAERKRLAGKR
ncbi:mucin-binding protein [Lacticaseibacillus parakribbianus]|uniref:mucin-binding protein n=1 Tax=Lacticaseibacillus parakribbianus TaxID=2970927 RepID=UPI0021CAF990|nr:KxYKxGKxW signal peptide domain-containing protein [Lacticaseibacillus parakribbianus]